MVKSQSAKKVSDYLLFAYEVLEAEERAIAFSDAVALLIAESWRYEKMPESYITLMLELLVEFKMAEVVELPHPIQGMVPLRALRTIEDGYVEFDITQVEDMDLDDFRAQLAERRQALQSERKVAAIRKHLESLEAQLKNVEQRVTRAELTRNRRRSEVNDLQDRIQRGITRKETFGAYEAAVEALALAELKLQEVEALPKVIQYKIGIFKEEHGL